MKDDITFGSATALATKSKKSKNSSSTTAAQIENKENETTTASTSPSSSRSLTATGRSSSGKLAAGEKININTATAEQLDELYGIGPSRAQAIIDYRNEHGNFQSIEDIMKVNGIKEGEFDKIKDNITVR